MRSNDKIICIKVNVGEFLTLGNEYQVVSYNTDSIRFKIGLYNDASRISFYNDDQFITVEEYRNKIINDILL